MIIQIYSIRDTAAQAFYQPFYFGTEMLAQREFIRFVNDPRNEGVFSHPEDYELWHVGEFNDSDASIKVAEGLPKLIRLARDVKQRSGQVTGPG